MPSILKIKPFRNLWIGQAVSQFGDALYALIFLFMVGRLTGSKAMVGYVGMAQALPFLLLGPYAGAIADRVDRRRLMLFADLSSTLILGALAVVVALTKSPPVWLVFLSACLLSCVNVFFAPAKSAAVPRLVPTERLLEANSLSAATQNAMPLLGLGLSGSVLGGIYVLYPSGFFLTAILVNAASFFVSAAFVSRLPSIEPDRHAPVKSALKESLEGFQLLWRDQLLRVVLVLSGLLNLAFAPFMVVYVAVNNEWFGGSFATLAWFEFSFVLGMVVSSLLVSKLRVARPGLAFGLGLIVCGAFLAAMAFTKIAWLFAGANLICGLALPFAQIPIGVYVQTVVHDAFRGRVNSALMMVGMGAMPLGMAVAGLLTDAIGLEAMFLLMGGSSVAIALAGLMNRDFRTTKMQVAASV